MIRRVFLALLASASISGCAGVDGTAGEPYAGCLLAAANRREVLQAAGYLHPNIPARLLVVRFAGSAGEHAALIYALPEGFMGYDDTFAGSLPLDLPASAPFPEPMEAARRLFGRTLAPPVVSARWLATARR